MHNILISIPESMRFGKFGPLGTMLGSQINYFKGILFMFK